jgi:hypothetical protein
VSTNPATAWVPFNVSNPFQNRRVVNIEFYLQETDPVTGQAELRNIQVYNNDNYIFKFNGNQSYEIYAEDLAGNFELLMGTVLVNPQINISFFNVNTSSLLTNYTFGGRADVNGTWSSFIYNDLYSLGTNSFEFDKFAFVKQNFTVNITNTTKSNIQFNVTPARIDLTIRDKNNLNIITGNNFSVELIGSVGIQTSTVTGLVSLQNALMQPGQYRILVSSDNYTTEEIIFDFNAQQILNVTAYMLNSTASNAGFVTIKAVDGLGNPIPSTIVEALQWNSGTSSFVKVSGAITGLDGKANLNIILNDKVYIFRAVRLGISAETPELRITTAENGKEIAITLGSSQTEKTYLFQNLEFNVTQVSFINNISTIRFYWLNTDSQKVNACINVYRYVGISETRLSESCENEITGIMLESFFINSSHNIRIKAEIKVDNAFYTLKSFDYPAENSLPKIISLLGFEFVIIPFLFLLSIALAIKMESLHIGGFFLFLASGLSLILVPTLITGGIVIFLNFVSGVIIWGAIGGRK